MTLAWRSIASAILGTAALAVAQDHPQPLPLANVAVHDDFWSARLKVWRTTTVNDCLDKFETSGAVKNFDLIAGGDFAGKHSGAPWFDGLVYEMITASADLLVTQPDPALKERIDAIIARIDAAAATQHDGYLETYTLAKEPTHRWGVSGGNDRFQHDLYNAGCLAEAAVHYYRATGDIKLLGTAVRLADLMCDTMGPPPKQNIIPGHAIAELAFFQLSQLLKEQPDLKTRLGLTGDEARYATLAQFWIDARGHHAGRADYGAYDQDHVPVADQKDIEGHAVRAVLLATGMAMIANDGNRPDYGPIALRWWQNMTQRRAYLTGGVGASAEEEKFGDDYVLPNTGYGETCAAVGAAFFDTQIFRQTADGDAVDAYERSLYNGALTGVSVSGTSYFYENPLQADPGRNRWAWHDCPCCPPMFLKLMASMPTNIYATTNDSLYVNLFIGSTAKAQVGGQEVTVTQTTGYPWKGDATLKIEPKQAGRFAINVRVPSWCRTEPADALYRSDRPVAADRFTVAVNGQATPVTVDHGYARINRQWQPGDTVAVHVDVAPRTVVANTAVEADRGKLALAAGPVIYCLESTDQSVPLEKLSVSAGDELVAAYQPDLLGGVGVLSGHAWVRDTDQAAHTVEFQAIPFFATANRGPRSMEVWVPKASTVLQIKG